MTLTATPYITVFSCPRAFTGSAGRAQRNALTNWRALGGEMEILLMGDDPGVAGAAAEFGCRHIPGIARNRWGTPLLDDIFRKGREATRAPLLCYINTDILLPPSFSNVVKAVGERWRAFLLAGRRWNVDFPEKMDFNGDWARRLEETRMQRGVLFTPDAIDYFVFPKEQYADMPPFAIGRYAWDNWILRKSVAEGFPIIDATEAVPIVHQNHEYGHIVNASVVSGNRVTSPECKMNYLLLNENFPGTNARNGSLAAASLRMTKAGIRQNITADRLRWCLYTWFNDFRLAAKDTVRCVLGEKALRILVTIKRKLVGGPKA